MGQLKSAAEMRQAIANAFALNTKVDTMYTTPDGNVFADKHFAEYHAGKTPGTKVNTVSRQDYEDDILAVEKNIAGAAKKRSDDAAKVVTDAEAKKQAEQDAAQAAAEKVTADLKASAIALGVVLDGSESDADLKTLIAEAKEQASTGSATGKYVAMTYIELKAACDARTPAIVYPSNVKRLDLIAKLEAADVAAATPTTGA